MWYDQIIRTNNTIGDSTDLSILINELSPESDEADSIAAILAAPHLDSIQVQIHKDCNSIKVLDSPTLATTNTIFSFWNCCRYSIRALQVANRLVGFGHGWGVPPTATIQVICV